MRRFVLVTAAKSEPGKSDIHGAGIKKLKRGVTIQDFIHDFFAELRIDSTCTDTVLVSSDAHILERNGTFTVVYHTETYVLMWSFTEYKEQDLTSAVKHLTRDELRRDLKELQPLKELKL